MIYVELEDSALVDWSICLRVGCVGKCDKHLD